MTYFKFAPKYDFFTKKIYTLTKTSARTKFQFSRMFASKSIDFSRKIYNECQGLFMDQPLQNDTGEGRIAEVVVYIANKRQD